MSILGKYHSSDVSSIEVAQKVHELVNAICEVLPVQKTGEQIAAKKLSVSLSQKVGEKSEPVAKKPPLDYEEEDKKAHAYGTGMLNEELAKRRAKAPSEAWKNWMVGLYAKEYLWDTSASVLDRQHIERDKIRRMIAEELLRIPLNINPPGLEPFIKTMIKMACTDRGIWEVPEHEMDRLKEAYMRLWYFEDHPEGEVKSILDEIKKKYN